ncbi:OTU domain-containing protein 5-B-like [Paramacrobiotus metropolitanus]|uniref:OTU domain-containing protein 5-B-like n=1 Tax=Paramacrobiotus metropolitanus TaxID=2943436 RepID=UPI00244640CA|nr:OTU domain-containing protein 5-B-like [Paramacrobiotus metropolitanus]
MRYSYRRTYSYDQYDDCYPCIPALRNTALYSRLQNVGSIQRHTTATMTILPKKKIPKERNEDRASTSRGHHASAGNLNQQTIQGSLPYSLLQDAVTSAQNPGTLNTVLNSFSSSPLPGPSRSSSIHRLGDQVPISTAPPAHYISKANRNKKQKVYSDDEENDTESDGSQGNIQHCSSSLLSISPDKLPDNDGHNSDDERCGYEGLSAEEWAQKEAAFARLLKEKRGFVIKLMKEDGACLFRAVADQVYGDQEMHDMVRRQCMDYMERNEDYFSQYITEDFQQYVERKRNLSAHGNHVEIQAMSEVYNRRIEVYQYDIDPINVFQGTHPQENAPIRVSYHMKSHYNSVIDPFAATVGVGLGLPNLQPGLAEQGLVAQAVGQSEQDVIEKQMLQDKLLASDWEATDEAIEQQIAQESYLDWLKHHEKKSCDNGSDTSGPSTSSLSESDSSRGEKSIPNREGSPKLIDSPSKTHILDRLNDLPPSLFGLNDWDEEDGDMLAQVLAASQAEYLESLKHRDGNCKNP